VQQQGETNAAVAAQLAELAEAVKNLNHRLLGADGQEGALPYLARQFEAHKQDDDRHFADLKKPVDSLLRARLSTKRWIAGALFVLSAEGTLLAFLAHYWSAAIEIAKAAAHK
jgi:hypothetical protein